MLKNFIKSASLLAALSLSANSFAGVITDTVTQNVKVSNWYHSYTHDINDDGFVLGSALSGNLSINIYDDGDLWGEGAVITVESFDLDSGGAWGTIFGSASAGWAQDLEVNALVELNTDGFLNVKVSGLGDFFVGNSVLTVTTQDNVAQVSEPATLALLGLGLLGLGLSRKKLSA